ncbi:MAG: DUF2993 domain-containing protein [Armatimonadota bacterium]|nr:DUF2993 domain-containing protein [Armatimonadota bacterium]
MSEVRMCMAGPKLRLTGAALCALLIVCVTGCGGGNIRRKIEIEIAKSLQKKLGPAESYAVSVAGSTVSLVRGSIKEIQILGLGVYLREGIILDRLDIVLKGIRVDPASRAIKNCSQARYTATISAVELEKYIRKRYPDIPELGIRLTDQRLHIQAAPQVAGVRIPVTATASLKTKDGTQIVLDLKSVDVGPIPTPGFAREYLEKRLNPVFEASAIGFEAQIDEVTIENGSLVLTGTFDPAKALDETD